MAFRNYIFLPMFSRSFIVSGLTLRSLIHFEFIFVYGVRKCILLQVVDQFSQHHLLKRLSFLYCIFLPPLSKIRCPQVRGFISGLSHSIVFFLFIYFLFFCIVHLRRPSLGFLFCSIDLYFCLCASTILS